jgi:hypothetical protein
MSLPEIDTALDTHLKPAVNKDFTTEGSNRYVQKVGEYAKGLLKASRSCSQGAELLLEQHVDAGAESLQNKAQASAKAWRVGKKLMNSIGGMLAGTAIGTIATTLSSEALPSKNALVVTSIMFAVGVVLMAVDFATER